MLSLVPTLFVVTLSCPTLAPLPRMFAVWVRTCMFACAPRVVCHCHNSAFYFFFRPQLPEEYCPPFAYTHPSSSDTPPPTHIHTLTNAPSQSKSHWHSEHVLYFGVVTFCCVHGPELYSRGKSAHSLCDLSLPVCLSVPLSLFLNHTHTHTASE